MPENSAQRTSLPARQSGGFSVWKSLLLPVLIVIALFGLFEILARLPAARLVFPLRSYGNYLSQFEIKWQKLEHFVQENGGVDIIFLGNSMVNTGVDPAQFLKDYPESRNSNLRVFNFGVEGLAIVPLVDLAQLLVNTYHPNTIVFYTEIRDYMAGNGDTVADLFLSNHWLQYRMGKTSPIGWFVDHSIALQSLLTWRNWFQPDFLDNELQNRRRWVNTHSDGYEPEKHLVTFSGEFPDPNDENDQYYFNIYQNYEVDPSRLDSLAAILALEETGTRVWITEFPAYPGFYKYFGGQKVYEDYLKRIRQFIANRGGIFIPSINPDLIPLSGRSDDHHINYLGAEIYSGLLANQFIEICRFQNLCLVGE